MNRDWVLFNLREAHDALTRTITEMQEDGEYDVGTLAAELSHLYHHLNSAWNGRDATAEEVANVTDKNFRVWSQFPADLILFE